MICHASNPNLAPPELAAQIIYTTEGVPTHVLSVTMTGDVLGSIDDAIEICKQIVAAQGSPMEKAFIGFLRAIKKARETR